jgi:hypothetical protein
MIKYRTVFLEPEMKSDSAWSEKRYQLDLVDFRLKIQATLEEYDEMGYDLFQMETLSGNKDYMNRTLAFVLIFKLRV